MSASTPATAADLDAVRAELARVTRLVGRAMRKATAALLTSDLSLAEQVIHDDDEIDIVTATIEQQCFELISRGHADESALRTLVGALRMAASLERMGDLARHVAKQARLRYPRSAVPESLAPTFTRMGEIAETIVGAMGDVITKHDLSLTGDIATADAEMDQLHRELFTIVLAPTWDEGVEAAIDITLLSRYYERYADHAVSVTKRMINVLTGEPYVAVSLD